MTQRKPSTRQRVGRIASLSTMLTISASALTIAACNDHPVQFISTSGAIQKTIPTSATKQVDIDILWMIDNSGSMCEEQKVLRENFQTFIQQLTRTTINFHIGVTTTHVPPSNFPGSVEPVSIPFQLQSTPQPVPGSAPECTGTLDNGFGPIRDTITVALSCLADPADSAPFESWTDVQINCALRRQTAGCPTVDANPEIDTNGDGAFDVFDLFPQSNQYRAIPKVLRANDYRLENGTIDEARLDADFGCMSLVGTRGFGIEKGIQAVVNALDPALTGGAFEDVENMAYDPAAPNHGLIRKDSGLAVIFVTDENDCSSDTLDIFADACGERSCDYYNSSAIPDEQSPLWSISFSKERMLEHLNATKGRVVSDGELLMASIHGQANRPTGPLPECPAGMEQPLASPTCSSPTLGSAYSGDRYERFIRSFTNFYPNANTLAALASGQITDPQDLSVTELGLLCGDDFSEALSAIGQFIAETQSSCILDTVMPCEESSECPNYIFSENPSECKPFPGRADQKYCDSGLILKLELEQGSGAQFPEIANHPFCQADSFDRLGGSLPSCVISPEFYSWVPCDAGVGLTFQWSAAAGANDNEVAQKLTGYRMEQIYNTAVGAIE